MIRDTSEYGDYVRRIDTVTALVSAVGVLLPTVLLDAGVDDEPTLRAALEGLDSVITAVLYGNGADALAGAERAHDALWQHFDPDHRYHHPSIPKEDT